MQRAADARKSLHGDGVRAGNLGACGRRDDHGERAGHAGAIGGRDEDALLGGRAVCIGVAAVDREGARGRGNLGLAFRRAGVSLVVGVELGDGEGRARHVARGDLGHCGDFGVVGNAAGGSRGCGSGRGAADDRREKDWSDELDHWPRVPRNSGSDKF